MLNFGVQSYEHYRIGVPKPGYYRELISSDHPAFGGSGKINETEIPAEAVEFHGQPYSIEITVPPLGGTILKRVRKQEETTICSQEKKTSK